MMVEEEKIIRAHLVGKFEEKFFDACMANLHEKENPLRLNNFAYSMRELIRNVLSRMAPEDEVKQVIWYKAEKEVKKPTRAQLMKYTVQGWLSDETMHEVLHLDIDKALKELRDSIDDLSKYTHVGEATFNVSTKEVEKISKEVMVRAAKWLLLIDKTREAVQEAIYECVNEDMIQQFYQTTNPDIDLLSTHHEIEEYWVNEIEKEDDGNGCVHVSIKGSVDVRLQYGSDGDMRRGIGWDTDESFPFTSELDVSYKNKYGDIRILEDGEYTFDVDSFYGGEEEI